MKKELERLINQRIVADTRSSWIYIGTLENVTGSTITLKDADAHDCGDSSTPKELYIFEARTTGIRANRTSVHINLDYIVSFSLFDDVKIF